VRVVGLIGRLDHPGFATARIASILPITQRD
jgi:hypothetical protein